MYSRFGRFLKILVLPATFPNTLGFSEFVFVLTSFLLMQTSVRKP